MVERTIVFDVHKVQCSIEHKFGFLKRKWHDRQMVYIITYSIPRGSWQKISFYVILSRTTWTKICLYSRPNQARVHVAWHVMSSTFIMPFLEFYPATGKSGRWLGEGPAQTSGAGGIWCIPDLRISMGIWTNSYSPKIDFHILNFNLIYVRKY